MTWVKKCPKLELVVVGLSNEQPLWTTGWGFNTFSRRVAPLAADRDDNPEPLMIDLGVALRETGDWTARFWNRGIEKELRIKGAAMMSDAMDLKLSLTGLRG